MNSDPLSESRPAIGKRKRVRDVDQGLADPALCLVLEGSHLRPTRCDAGQIERVAMVASGVAAVVGDQIYLAEPRTGVIPLGESPDRDLAPEDRTGLVPERPFMRSLALSGESIRSIVAAEMFSIFRRTSVASSISPWRSNASIASAMHGARRLPAGPPKVAHTKRRGPKTSCP